jgi:hypothetical protein
MRRDEQKAFKRKKKRKAEIKKKGNIYKRGFKPIEA